VTAFTHQFTTPTGDRYFATMPDTSILNNQIPAGAFTIHKDIEGHRWLTPSPAKVENIIEMPDPASKQVLDFISQFFTDETKAAYQRYGILYRAGVLMHGKPGTGKTYTIHKLTNAASAQGFVILRDPHPTLVKSFVDDIRRITNNPEQPVLVIWEEFDDLIECGYETSILQLLDGASSVEHIIYLATSNYINKIPERMKSRPSRFNQVIEVGPPSADMRRSYFDAKLHPDDKAKWLNRMVEISEGLVLDFCKELILGLLVYKRDTKTEVERLRKMAGLGTLEIEGDETEPEVKAKVSTPTDDVCTEDEDDGEDEEDDDDDGDTAEIDEA
jgi:hypothetical protein